MNEIELPKLFKGPWQHALILTYGVNVPFLEGVLWRQFDARCRNKIILADGQQYLEACEQYARNGLVRHLNHKYVVEGIDSPRAAHGKVILLLSPEKGRLLVGSGNLSQQGYASGGELFTQYEYSETSLSSLAAFSTIRELVDGLIERGYVAGPVVKRIQNAWEQTPWLFQSADSERSVRHNLTHSFVAQLQQVIDNRPVEEMWILSPFYDQEATALAQLLSTVQPRQVCLLLQADQTSVDPVMLKNVTERSSSRCRAYAIVRENGNPYIHAKMYLLKLSDCAICLQGSPNLSQVAMLLSVPQGNVEVANLLVGSRDAYDGLVESLDPQLVEIDDLNLSYEPVATDHRREAQAWYLTGGQWQEDTLCLRFHGPLPDLEGASLKIGSDLFPIDVSEVRAQELHLRLPTDAIHLLRQPIPVVLCWGEEESTVSNPVFVCDIAALDAVVSVTDDEETLDRFGDLDLDDEEFERLLGELDSALMIDRQSVWQLAGRDIPPVSEENDDALRLDYADVDYDALRRHPKIQQYTGRPVVDSPYGRTRLQIILGAITDHFNGLLDPSIDRHLALIRSLGIPDQDDQGTEEDHDREEQERQKRRWTQTQRLKRILKGFVRRYLRGIRSPDFQELAGFEVIAQNYVIFSHLLWRLFAREDWVEPQFVLESLLRTWSFFWGSAGPDGYFSHLTKEDRTLVLSWVREDHADAVMLATLYYSAFLSRTKRWFDLRLSLRDSWRDLLIKRPFPVTEQVLEESWHAIGHLIPYEPPTPAVIVNELEQLARFDTRDHFCRTMERTSGFPPGSCFFDDQCRIHRESLGRSDTVSCLTIDAVDALSDQDSSMAILEAWMRFEERDYYRLHQPDANRLLFYDVVARTGLYYCPGSVEVELEAFEPRCLEWENPILKLVDLAQQVETNIRSALPRPEAVIMGDSASMESPDTQVAE